MIIAKDTGWCPPRSPIGMLQEDMWEDPWKVLVVCCLHNQTSRKQVDKVYQKLFEAAPTHQAMASINPEVLSEILKPLGFYNRRTKSLIKMSKQYGSGKWTTASDLYGCGKYADDCYKVFCTGEWESVNPTDHALNDYVDWLKKEKNA